MKKIIIGCIFLSAVFSQTVIADVTLVDNQPMSPINGNPNWYEYNVLSLNNGDYYNIIFNNGGWEGGQTADLYVESAENVCFSSSGTDSDIVQIDCPTTDVNEVVESLGLYSQDGKIKGYYEGVVLIYNLSSECLQVIDSEGSFTSRNLQRGIYVVKFDQNEGSKIFVF
ncbi:MAG: hypothetical protein EOL95_01520 [Bacteroidia bacterium]|nr:hypothetical protein [Bacteroidia bacterium]